MSLRVYPDVITSALGAQKPIREGLFFPQNPWCLLPKSLHPLSLFDFACNSLSAPFGIPHDAIRAMAELWSAHTILIVLDGSQCMHCTLCNERDEGRDRGRDRGRIKARGMLKAGEG